MRTRIFLVFIVCFAIGFLGSSALASDAKVRETVDKSVKDLTEKIKSSKDLKSVWKDFSKTENEAKSLRKKEKRQSETDENHLDNLLSSLHEIPRDKKIVKANCEKVKNKIYAEYSPHELDDGGYPEFIQLTEGVLQALCAK